MSAPARRPGPPFGPGVTAELWPDPPAADDPVGSGGAGSAPARAAATGIGAPGGTGRSAGGVTVAGAAPPTPELLAAVAALPPARERPRLAGAEPTAPDPGFRLARLLRPVRGPLALAVLLVGLDALGTLAFPTVARFAVDGGITAGSGSALRTATLLGIGLVAIGWLVVAAQTVVTARAGESLLYLLRVRSYAHLQRLGLDYYERELSGRIMTRMTTDVDALSTFLQTGLAQAVVSVLTVVGVAVALLLTDAGAGPGRVGRAAGADGGHRAVPAQLVGGLRGGPGAGQRGQRRPAGERHRGAGGPGLRPGGAQRRAVRRAQRRLPAVPDAGAAADRHLLPVRGPAVRRGPGRGARGRREPGGGRRPDPGRAHRVPALPRPVLRAGAAAVPGVRRLPAGPDRVAADR